MGYDVAEGLGGLSMGAKLGSNFGPLGTAIGAGAGLFAGFLEKPEAEQYVDPNKGAVDQEKYQLLNSHIGADLASRTASHAKRAANLSMENIKNRPGFGNAAVLGDLYDAANRSAEGTAMDANLQGQAYDQSAKAQGAQLAQKQTAQDEQIWSANKALRDQPNALQSAGLSFMGNLAGGGADALSGIGGLMGGGSDAPPPNPTLQPFRPSQQSKFGAVQSDRPQIQPWNFDSFGAGGSQ